MFGNAILTRVPVKDVQQAAYSGQEGKEERRWMCVETVQGVTVCGSHLAVSRSVSAQEAQCRELENLLAERAAEGPTFFGGDVNRRTDCASDGMWVTTDAGATQAPGIQHIYGSNTAKLVSSTWQPATYTDHPFLITTSIVPPRGHR